ncbi:MAG: hypothetical protein ABSC61_02920 [Anaerolineales bacterium]
MLKTIIMVAEVLWVLSYIQRVVIPAFAQKAATISASNDDRELRE